MKTFKLTENFNGYINKKDVTKAEPGSLVSGSQNVLINDGEKITIRDGYSLYGSAATSLNPIISSYTWNTSTGTEIPIRAYDDELEFYYSGAWRRLADSFTSISFNFAEWWATNEAKDLLLFVNGDSSIRMWSGGITTFASATANTITKQGTTTWAEDRFLVAGTRQVIIDGVTYTYTGGESTTTLTGVTPDPTGGSHTAGDVVHQAIRTTANTPAAAVDNDIIGVLNNQIYIADSQRRDLYVSKAADYTDFTFSSPRLPAEGALLTLDSPAIGFAVQDSNMYISGSKSEWYQTKFILSSDLTKESLSIERLKSGPGQGALSQAGIANIKNLIIFFDTDSAVNTLGQIENVNTPQNQLLSDPIKTELQNYDTTIPPHIKFWKNRTYIAFPSESKVIIFDHEKGYWLPPQILPVRRLEIIDGWLYGHSNAVPETYKLFDPETPNDNGNPIDARAYMSYNNFGRRDWKKIFDEYFVEGYISSNSELTCGINLDFDGFTSNIEFIVEGDNPNILFATTGDSSIGKNPLGSEPVGTVIDAADELSKFRTIFTNTQNANDFYEVQFYFRSNGEDQRWEILAYGPNAMLSSSDNIPIKQ